THINNSRSLSPSPSLSLSLSVSPSSQEEKERKKYIDTVKGAEAAVAAAAERNDRNYSSMKLELLAMKWAVTDKFRGYLLGSKFTVLTDNNPLCHLGTARLGALEQRWMAQLAVFDFEVQYM